MSEEQKRKEINKSHLLPKDTTTSEDYASELAGASIAEIMTGTGDNKASGQSDEASHDESERASERGEGIPSLGLICSLLLPP